MSKIDPLGDLRILWRLVRGMPDTGSSADKMEAFYSGQAANYDRFRDRLLHGRKELIAQLALPEKARIVELGCGTGRNLEFFGERISQLAHVDLVDLSPSLLNQAKLRWEKNPQVNIIEADACTWQPNEPVDCVFCSYSLTMIPDWPRVIANAIAMLKPGGVLGVVDFYVSDDTPQPQRRHHSYIERTFWKNWFAHDGVYLTPHHVKHLTKALPKHVLHERMGRVPYLPLYAPYYIFIGHKP